MSLFPQEDIEMGKGYLSRISLRSVRLITLGLLLALTLISAGIYAVDSGDVAVTPAAIAADHPGGSTGGG